MFKPKSAQDILTGKIAETMGLDLDGLKTGLAELQSKGPALVADIRSRVENIERYTRETNEIAHVLFEELASQKYAAWKAAKDSQLNPLKG